MWSLPVFLNLPPIKEHSEKPSELFCLPCCPNMPKIPTTEPQRDVLYFALQRKVQFQDRVGRHLFPAHFFYRSEGDLPIRVCSSACQHDGLTLLWWPSCLNFIVGLDYHKSELSMNHRHYGLCLDQLDTC